MCLCECLSGYHWIDLTFFSYLLDEMNFFFCVKIINCRRNERSWSGGNIGPCLSLDQQIRVDHCSPVRFQQVGSSIRAAMRLALVAHCWLFSQWTVAERPAEKCRQFTSNMQPDIKPTHRKDTLRMKKRFLAKFVFRSIMIYSNGKTMSERAAGHIQRYHNGLLVLAGSKSP